MSSNLSTNLNNLRILFFGRAGCSASENALELLKSFDCNIDVVTSFRRYEEIPEEINN